MSSAAVARAYDLHPNLFRRWVIEHQRQSGTEESESAEGRDPVPLIVSSGEVASPGPSFVPVQRAVRPVDVREPTRATPKASQVAATG